MVTVHPMFPAFQAWALNPCGTRTQGPSPTPLVEVHRLLQQCHRWPITAQHPVQKLSDPSRPQKFCFALLTVGEKWLRERSNGLFLNHPAESKARKVLSILTGLTKVASLVNFLLFLQRGTYSTLARSAASVQSAPGTTRHQLPVLELGAVVTWLC